MSDPRRAIVRRQRVDAYLGVVIRRSLDRQPTKEELRAMMADAARNTATLPPGPDPGMPAYAHGKTRSEQGGGSA